MVLEEEKLCPREYDLCLLSCGQVCRDIGYLTARQRSDILSVESGVVDRYRRSSSISRTRLCLKAISEHYAPAAQESDSPL